MGKRLFVANSRDDELSVIDAARHRILVSIPVGEQPFGVAVSGDGKFVYVVNTGSKTVSVFPTDLSDLQARTLKVGKGPVDIEIGPDNRTVVVVNEQSHSLSVAQFP